MMKKEYNVKVTASDRFFTWTHSNGRKRASLTNNMGLVLMT